MATGKRYYWIKLKETFMTSDAVDFLMSQPDGANYVVLYQMLCLKTINTGGKLERHIGEVIIPYDEAKIQRDCKWFSIDTIRVALNLYKSLGLVYADKDGSLCLTDHSNLVGSETDYSQQKRNQRKALLPAAHENDCVDNVHQNVLENVHTDIRDRDKRLEIRDKEIKSIEKESKKKEKADAFSEFAGDDSDLLSALKDFEKMRKSIGKPLTERAKTMLLNKLQTFEMDEWIPILEQSIFHNWQGIFGLHDSTKEGKTAGMLHESYDMMKEWAKE